ncbi:MAG TPA: peptidylprolyl isomerase [Vicinamibacteria bacterium]|nr:peptidylprolyl isomerase [Vicinamibacteria bacterium]
MSSTLALLLLAAAEGAAPLPQAVVTTSEGAFVIRLLPDLAPKHVAHFLKVAKAGGFDGTTFHRIILRGIIQGGDPLSKDPGKVSLYGTGGLGLLKAEFTDRPMVRGAVAAVRRPRDPNSAGQQFFVVLADQPSLTGQFTIFGEVVSGLDVADRIGETAVEGDRAKTRVEMKVTLAPATGEPAP